MADFFAYHDGYGLDMKDKEEIKKISAEYNIQVILQINNDSGRSIDDTVHTFTKKWATYEREAYIKRLSRNQSTWNYRLMYPVFFPVFLNQYAYNAEKDGDILKAYIDLMDLYNKAE